MSPNRIGLSRQTPDTEHLTEGNERLSAAVAEQAGILSLLYDISRELTSILDLEQLLRAVAVRVKHLVDYDVFNVMLVNNETNRLEHAFSLRYDEKIQVSQTLALGEGLCGAAVTGRTPVRVDRVANDPRYIQCELAAGIQSELVIPLIVQERVLGVLDLESLRASAFTEWHEHMLAALASTVAIALENARLYDRLRRTEQRRKDDLQRAREMQMLLLPDTMPEVPGVEIAVRYSPAQELGGDFYDFLPYDGGRLAIAVGDVAGKGSAAALLASLGIGILREHAVHRPCPPAAMLADLNGHLLIPGANGRFITMALAVYDPATSELVLANAGFPLPLLLRNGEIRPIDVTGLPMGLFRGSTYDPATLQLQPGDVLVFCSDGVLDQTNAAQEEFGAERLRSQLADSGENPRASEVASLIMRSVERYAGDSGSGQSIDDRTVVVLRVL